MIAISSVLAIAAVGPASIVDAALGPVTATYPSAGCPSDGTHDLQTCIDTVADGSTIQLAQDVIDEFAFVTKSLTLEPAAGFHPVMQHVTIEDSGPASAAVHVTVRNIQLTDYISASFQYGSGHSVTIHGVQVGRNSASARGISLIAGVSASFLVEDSFVRSVATGVDGIQLYSYNGVGTVLFRVVGNQITLHGASQGGSGIMVDVNNGGTARADLLDNSIWDVAQVGAGGGASGIQVYPDTGVQAEVNIVGNTVDTSGTNGILVRGVAAPGHLSLDLFNNVLSHAHNDGVNIDQPASGTLTFRAGFNDFFANRAPNEFAGFAPGPGNLTVNPRFADRANGDLRLTAASPLIDAGEVCSPGGVANLDAAGHGRLAGTSVDIGAYERGATTPNGVALVGDGGANVLKGTSGNDILCGLGGNDTLLGKGGNDYLDGGPGDDTIVGGSGSDRMFGDAGSDTFCARDGTHGNDRIYGGSGSDRADADSGDIKVSVEHPTSCTQ